MPGPPAVRAPGTGDATPLPVKPPPGQMLTHSLLNAVHRLPAPLGEDLLAAAALVQGMLAPGRWRRAYRWAASQPGRERLAWRLACALLAHRGRYLAMLAQVGLRDRERFRRRLVLEGRERLDAAWGRGGVLLLGFHVGSGAEGLALEVSGYPVTHTGRGRVLQRAPRRPTQDWMAPTLADAILWTDGWSRVAALYAIRRRLLDGRIVHLMGDGDGTEAFQIPLPGRALVVRSGWLSVRRSIGVPTFPVLGHREGRRLVVTIHPPFPSPRSDPAEDLAACRAALTPILVEYVRRFPEQCFMLALDRTPAA
jgi:lauroyl/myristoyl acyltransferase